MSLWLGQALALVPSADVVLTNISQVRALSAEQAAQGRTVRLQAVVTFHSPAGACFIQDETGGIYLGRRSLQPVLRLGDRIDLEGTTAPGDYAPIAVEKQVTRLSSGKAPVEEAVTFARLASGQMDCRFVEVQGIIRWLVDSRPSHLLCGLAMPGGKIRVYVYRWPDVKAEELLGATLRIRGAVGASFNRQRQLVAPWIYVDSPDQILIENPGPRGPEDIPLTSAGTLLQHGSTGQFAERVRVRGVVLQQAKGQYLFIRDGEQGLQLLTVSTLEVEPGSVIEACGYPLMGIYSPILEDADFQVMGKTAPPDPVQVSVPQVLEGKCNSDLISVEANLVDYVQRGNEQVLVLQESNVLFSAHLPADQPSRLESGLARQSRLRLTGVCFVHETTEVAARLAPVSFRVLLRSSRDISVVRRASWWTTGRLLGAVSLLGLAVGMAMVWVLVLRRKVRQQTEFIGERLRHEAALEERTRVARELHDSIEQSLVGIAMQMDTAAAKLAESPQTTSRLLDTSRHLIRRTQAELHASVWDLRSRLLEEGGLMSALEQLVQSLIRAGVQSELEISGEPRALSAVVENHLLRLAQEMVSNVVKHAEANAAWIRVSFEADRIGLSVTDNGSGFDARQSSAAGEGHFGLVGMRERVTKLGGEFSLESAPRKGTRVSVTIPNLVPIQRDAKLNQYSNR